MHNLSVLETFNREVQDLHRLYHFPFPTRIKILIVTDGSASFDPSLGFGLGTVLDIMKNDPWWWVKFEFTKAHRGTDPMGAANNGTPYEPDFQNFHFVNSFAPANAPKLADFQQIWLFGVLSTGVNSLQPNEMAAIHSFMDNGGGVFATGDHADLGASLNSQIKRVRHMRKWTSGGVAGTPPPQSGVNRHDTLRTGSNSTFEFIDQSDDTPQVITPRMYHSWSPFPWRYNSFPHPVLCGRNGMLKVLPDHMHEGEIVAPTAATVAADPGEWPGGVGPEVIAHATVLPQTAANSTVGPVNPKTFGVLGAYNGHEADVGRIVVDATWHHWFNINLMGFSPGSAHYADIKNYFWNVGLWLSPQAYQAEMFAKAVYGFTLLSPFNELSPALPILYLGQIGRDAIGRRAAQCTIREWLWWRYPIKLRPLLKFPPELLYEVDFPYYRGPYLIEDFALGGVIRQMLEQFNPLDPPKERPDDKTLLAIVERGVKQGLREMAGFETRSAEHSLSLARAIEETTQNGRTKGKSGLDKVKAEAVNFN